MSLKDQLYKTEPTRPSKAIEEEDLVRVWSIGHPSVRFEKLLTHFEHVKVAAEIAAWENRIRKKGWLPVMQQGATTNAMFFVCHAMPRDPHIEDQITNLESAVLHHERNLEQVMKVIERLQSGIVRPL